MSFTSIAWVERAAGAMEKESMVQVVEACENYKDGVATTDVQLGELVWVRIFRPQDMHGAPSAAKPVVLYVHGGAYSFGQPSFLPFHRFCASMCKLSSFIWVSVSYRLAPQHRLPAAYDDGSLALSWLAAQARQQLSKTCHRWLTAEMADFAHCFLAGESAGAAIVLKVARDTAAMAENLGPLCIKGLVLIDPGFQTEEKRGVMVDEELGMKIDKLYEMALPEGETLDYAPVNPLHADAPPLEPLATYPHIFISIGDRDYRYDYTVRFYEHVRGLCGHAQLFVTPGKGHVFHLLQPLCHEAQRLQLQLVNFIQACAAI